jgi:serine/threonine protein phosphatase PrpC
MVIFGQMTNAGDRENNEDSIGLMETKTGFLFAVADGLGGHGKGELASSIAVERAIVTFAGEDTFTRETLEKCFDSSQKGVLEVQASDRSARDMKTTLVLLHVGSDTVRWGHIGDTRLYYFLKGKLIERTLDHSVPQMLVASGEIRESQIRRHPDRNRLLRVIGTEWDSPRYQIDNEIPREPGQAFLLCTDGFWEHIVEKKMLHALKHSKSPQEWIDRMTKDVLADGRRDNMDNFSATAVWVTE